MNVKTYQNQDRFRKPWTKSSATRKRSPDLEYPRSVMPDAPSVCCESRSGKSPPRRSRTEPRPQPLPHGSSASKTAAAGSRRRLRLSTRLADASEAEPGRPLRAGCREACCRLQRPPYRTSPRGDGRDEAVRSQLHRQGDAWQNARQRWDLRRTRQSGYRCMNLPTTLIQRLRAAIRPPANCGSRSRGCWQT